MSNTMKLGIVILYLTVLVVAQTRIDTSQIRGDLVISPIQAFEMQQCVGSGPGVPPTGLPWDCANIMYLKVTLTNGKILGPYYMTAVPPAGQVLDPTMWKNVPLQ